MKAVAVVPGTPDSVHLRDVPRPSIDVTGEGRGVRVRIIRAGLCGTDVELVEGRFGAAPQDSDHLVIGHESLGEVVEVGPSAAGDIKLGQLVVATIRRPGDSVYDRIGLPDLSTDSVPIECGLRQRHGFMVEEIVDAVEYLVPVPDALEEVAILTEPLSCITKALRQADEVQARLRHWEPQRALVTGAGTIGLLATLALRLRGLDVTTYSRRPAPYRNSELVEQIGARYLSSSAVEVVDVVDRHGPFDIVFEGSGAPELFVPSVGALAANGVLALFSVTSGSRSLPVDVAQLNQAIVLGNRALVGSAAATHDDYVEAVATLGRAQAEPATRGWLANLLTTRIAGFDIEAIKRQLDDGREAIKATVEIAATSTST